jgi:hypothetical protein
MTEEGGGDRTSLKPELVETLLFCAFFPVLLDDGELVSGGISPFLVVDPSADSTAAPA